MENTHSANQMGICCMQKASQKNKKLNLSTNINTNDEQNKNHFLFKITGIDNFLFPSNFGHKSIYLKKSC